MANIESNGMKKSILCSSTSLKSHIKKMQYGEIKLYNGVGDKP